MYCDLYKRRQLIGNDSPVKRFEFGRTVKNIIVVGNHEIPGDGCITSGRPEVFYLFKKQRGRFCRSTYREFIGQDNTEYGNISIDAYPAVIIQNPVHSRVAKRHSSVQ
jgi:hypothetical protein